MEDQPVVVVIDDSPTIRKILEVTLKRSGVKVVGAASGVGGLAAIAANQPALIFLDVVLPTVSGYQLCKVLKGNPQTRHTPVVMLSGKDGVFDKVRGRLAGANDYITKPFAPGSILAMVKKYLPQAAAVRVTAGAAR